MANIAIFRINYKSDFILTLNSDAGWLTPFCIKFWTGAPSQAYFASFDGTTYTHCAPVEGEPTKLVVQFDDHHLPIGDLKFQIGYHFTVDDFPTTIEDEVMNQASVIIEVDDAPAQVMLDLNGETAPEIEFALPAYANEQQRIANEEQRIENEQARVAAEEARVAAENARVDEFAQLKTESEEATANANAAAQLATEKAALAQQKADYAQTQGDYAKTQGDYAKSQGDIAQADHQRAESDHATATADHTQAASDHSTATADHTQAVSDHTQAAADHTRAESDHTRAESDHEAVEVYVDSLGAFDISAYHATGGVLAKYADLTAALGTNGANIPDALRKGGMSVKFVLSSDNKYVQYFLTKNEWSVNEADWEKMNLEEDVSQLGQEIYTSFVTGKTFIKRKGYCRAEQYNYWRLGPNDWHYVFPVNEGDVIVWSGTNTDYYLLLSDYITPVENAIPSYTTGYDGRQYKGGAIKNLTIPTGCKYFVLENDVTITFTSLTINGYNVLDGAGHTLQSISKDVDEMKQAIPSYLKENDLGYIVVSDNLADKNNILDKVVADNGILYDSTTNKCVVIPLKSSDAGKSLTFGGFYMGRSLYGAFYNGNTIVGTRFSANDPNGRENPGTVIVPSGCDRVYIDIYNQETAPRENPYEYLMVNFGTILLPYDEFEKQIQDIRGTKIYGTGGESQNIDIIVDLPVSVDGSDIQTGYAYINAQTGIVTVKL